MILVSHPSVITCMVSLSPVASDGTNTSSLELGGRGSDAFSVASRTADEPIEPFVVVASVSVDEARLLGSKHAN